MATNAEEGLNERFSILMLPWLAHSHISTFFELSKSLSYRNFHIFFCSTSVNLDAIKPNLKPPASSNIQLVELHLPSSTQLPPHLHTANGLPSHLISTLLEAFSMAAPNFETILQTLKPHLVIYDCLQPWAPRVASSLNIPAINYVTVAGSVVGLHLLTNPGSEYPFSEFAPHNHRNSANATPDGASTEKTAFAKCLYDSCNVILVNSFRELEGKYLDHISLLLKKKVVPVGPLIHEPPDDDHYSSITNWLDKKEPSSTVFVSFGTEYFPPKEEMEEIAYGLELSQANFIWVVRFPKGDDRNTSPIEEALPAGFLERVGDGERGMVVKDWAPQTKILKHRNTGGFVSHCGWNSVLESLTFGVPIIGVPKHVDQPHNARLVEAVGVGVEAKRDSEGKIERDEIAKLIKEVMVEKRGEEVRKKAQEMSELLKRKDREDKIDEMVAEISLLLHK